jgi:hypothetical protein
MAGLCASCQYAEAADGPGVRRTRGGRSIGRVEGRGAPATRWRPVR